MLWEEVLEFVESKVCLDGSARYAIAHGFAQANKFLAKWKPVVSYSWFPRKLRLNIAKNHNAAEFSLEFEDDGESSKRQDLQLECENGGKRDWNEEATMDGSGPM